tara:strand:- start:514 stop:1680 length:1167 start_codon:yes stop_codon:yes gene_type:complete
MSNYEENWKNFLKEGCWEGYEQKGMKKKGDRMVPNCVPISEETRDTYGSEVVDRNKRSVEKGSKKLGLEEKDDRCTRIAKRKYDVWPSAYASGAVVKCRQGKIWKGVKEGEEPGLEIKIRKALRDEGGAAGMDALVDHAEASESDIKAAIKDMDDVGQHKNGDYILDDGEDIDILEEDLRKWFGRKGEKGSKGGWVDCNAPDGEGGYKECAQGDRKKKPACRPTPSACKDPGKGKKWGKKATKEALNMKITKEELEQIIFEEVKEVYYETFIFPHLTEAWLEDGTPVCTGCLHELLNEASCDCPHLVYEAEYRGRKVKLNKPMRGDVKKFKVYVKDPKTGNIKKVNFGQKGMKIRKSNPKARKSFRARHNCDNPGPKTKARYWSCKKW